MNHSSNEVQQNVQALVTAALGDDVGATNAVLESFDREMSLRVCGSFSKLVSEMIQSKATEVGMEPTEFWASTIATHGSTS